MGDNDLIEYRLQGLSPSEIAKVVSKTDKEIESLINTTLDIESNTSGIPVAILIELKRLDKLIAKSFDDLLNCPEDEYCEVSGRLTRDSFKTRALIVDGIRKLVEAKGKLLKLSIEYKIAKDGDKEDPIDFSSLSLADKLTKYREILDS